MKTIGRIVFAHADVERAGDRVGLDARRDAERRDVAARRDQRDCPARADAELVRQPRADDDGVAAAELRQRAVRQRVRNRRQRIQIARRGCRAQNTPARTPSAEASTWPSTMGATRSDAGHGAHAHRDGVEVGQMPLAALHDDMALKAEDPRQQFVAKAVHHRHHDDSVATPSAMPTSEKPEMTETKLSFRLARR